MKHHHCGFIVITVTLLAAYGFVAPLEANAQSSQYRLFLAPGGTLNGQTIDSGHNVCTVTSSQSITGTINIRAENDNCGGAIVPVEMARSWGDHASSWSTVTGHVPCGGKTYGQPINFAAPSLPGEYYIVFGELGQFAGGWIASMTSWTCGGSPVWNDGNDLADLDEIAMAGCLTSGWKMLPGWECSYLQYWPTGLTYVKIIVTSQPSGTYFQESFDNGDFSDWLTWSATGVTYNHVGPGFTMSAAPGTYAYEGNYGLRILGNNSPWISTIGRKQTISPASGHLLFSFAIRPYISEAAANINGQYIFLGQNDPYVTETQTVSVGIVFWTSGHVSVYPSLDLGAFTKNQWGYVSIDLDTSTQRFSVDITGPAVPPAGYHATDQPFTQPMSAANYVSVYCNGWAQNELAVDSLLLMEGGNGCSQGPSVILDGSSASSLRWVDTGSLFANIDYSGESCNSPVTRVEYFYDMDPGLGQGTQIPMPANAIVGTRLVEVSQPDDGEHILGIRGVNAAGNWGQTYTERVWFGSVAPPFAPATNALHFANDQALFQWQGCLPWPLADHCWDKTIPGLCMGMSAAAWLYHDLGYASIPGDGLTWPPTHSALDNEIRAQQLAGMIGSGAAWIRANGSGYSLADEYAAIRGRIAGSRPALLLLNKQGGGFGHVVLAYRMLERDQVSQVAVYDPNYPGMTQGLGILHSDGWMMFPYDPQGLKLTRVALSPYAPGKVLAVVARCPVVLELIDPEGHVTDPTRAEIAGSGYGYQLNDGGSDSARVVTVLEPNAGYYRVRVLPDGGAEGGSRFSLDVLYDDQVEHLAIDELISAAPGSGYSFTLDCGSGGLAVDTAPPSITLTLSPASLWPPNHGMVEVHAEVTVVDECDASPTVELVSVTSDEPDDGHGDGHFPNDIQEAATGTADFDFKLRSERAGGGDGRTYTICYSATDKPGNESLVCGTVVVPHNQSGRADLVAIDGAPNLVIYGSATAPVRGIAPGTVEIGTPDFVRVEPILQPGYADLNADGFEDARFPFAAGSMDGLGTDLYGHWVTEGVSYLASLSLGGMTETPDHDLPLGLSASVQPNPARGAASIYYSLPADCTVRLSVFDVTGREVIRLVDGEVPAGHHEARWAARSDQESSQLYLYRLNAMGQVLTGQFLVLR